MNRQLERVFASPDFDATRRSREFLRFIVKETIAGRSEAISQHAIATRVFDRKHDFDALLDPIVRIQAGRLRRSLERYYLLSGLQDPVLIALPKGSYVPVFRAAIEEAGARSGATSDRVDVLVADSAADGWPTVVVSGFEAGSDPEAVQLGSQLADELARELGRYGTVRLWRPSDRQQAPSSPGGVPFALDGRLRRSGQDLRITARLVDRRTGEQVWGDEYSTASERPNGSPADVARVIAARVAAEEGVFVQRLAAELRKLRPVAPTPFDAILLSYQFFQKLHPESLRPALEALLRVVDSEPECGLAWTRLAWLHLADYSFEVTASPPAIDEAISCAQRGARLDPASRSARCVLAAALLVKGELLAGREQLEQALRASPDSLVSLETIGCVMALLGDWERGAALSRSARLRNPHCLPHVLFGIWADHLRRGDVEQAYQAALEFRDPALYWRSLMRACCLGLLGRTNEARSEVSKLLSGKPDFPARGRVLIGHYIKFPEVMDPIVEGLARAGLALA